MSASLFVFASSFCAPVSFLNLAIASVWFSGKSLLGSIGGCPPLGEASVNSTPASRKTKYGAANSSSQNPVLRPVLPSTSCDVRTISIFMLLLHCLIGHTAISSETSYTNNHNNTNNKTTNKPTNTKKKQRCPA